MSSTTVWQAMLRFSPRLSTFSCVLAFRLMAEGCASSSAQRLSRILSFTGDSFGRCSVQDSRFRCKYARHVGTEGNVHTAPCNGACRLSLNLSFTGDRYWLLPYEDNLLVESDLPAGCTCLIALQWHTAARDLSGDCLGHCEPSDATKSFTQQDI